jgi:hypothetical protein
MRVAICLDRPLMNDQLDLYHPIIGLIILSLTWLLAIAGYFAHDMNKRKGSTSIVARIHLWTGRLLITLAMINGGLGLNISRYSTRSEHIAYGVVAGVMWLLFATSSVRHEVRLREGKVAVEEITGEKQLTEIDESEKYQEMMTVERK